MFEYSSEQLEMLVVGQCPNPIILLDEVEKSSRGQEKHKFSSALYGLLEKNNACQFRDEFIDVAMDASGINWFGTSNDASLLDDPLRDRFEVITVRAPHRDELAEMIPRIYKATVVERRLQYAFADALDGSAIEALLDSECTSIRRIHTMLEQGLGRAAKRCKGQDGQKIMLIGADILADRPDGRNGNRKTGMGFIWR